MFFRNHLKDYLYVSIGCVWYMCLFCGSTTFQRIVRLKGFSFESTTIWWLFQCLCLPLSSRWFRSKMDVSFVLVHSWNPCFTNTADYAFVFQPKFLDLAFGAALAIFLALEIIRVSSWCWQFHHLSYFINKSDSNTCLTAF